MSNIKYSLPGTETVTLAGQTIDKLIRAGDGDAALLYLFILKTRGQGTSEEACAALGKNPGAIVTAMAVLSRLGLVEIDGNNDAATREAQDTAPVKPPLDEPRQYSIDEIKNELKAGSEFHMLVQETQNSLGKILSPDELLRLFGIYDALRMPPEVVLQLITHCITESRGRGDGRKPSMRYIEKAAFTWEREGVLTLERAEEYLKALQVRKSVRGEIKRSLQIRDREFSATEKHYVDGWIEMGFGAEAVGIAYDRTVTKTGKLAWSYMDSIMKSWHDKRLLTPKEIIEKDRKPNGNGSQGTTKHPEQKFGSPDMEEIERMQRVLKKIKDT